MLNLFFYKNKNVVVFLVLIIISIFAMSQSSTRVELLLKDAFSVVSYPFTWLFYKSSTFIEDTYSNIIYFEEKLEEIKKIEDMLKESKELSKDNDSLIEEIISLKEQLNYLVYLEKRSEVFKKEKYIGVQSAEVIMRDSVGKLFNSLILNKGEKHGIKENMPVIAFQVIEELPGKPISKLVVGRIKEVSYLSSKLLPINSPKCIVHVRLKDHNFNGFIEGRGSFDRGLLLRNIDKRASISLNEEIVTTGGQSLFPAGIKIGKIIKDASKETDFMKQVIVKPYVNFSSLKYVFIIKRELSDLKLLVEDK